VNGRLSDAAYAAGWSLVRGTPEALARRQFDTLADLAWLRHGRGIQRLAANLRRVAPDRTDAELRALTRAAVRSYLRYWREVFQLPRLSAAEVTRRTVISDEHTAAVTAAATSGRGLVLALPHMGNWDWAGAWLVANVTRFTTVAERLEPASLFDRFVAFRESIGMEVLPLTGGERPPFAVLAERLRAGGTLCLLADRDLTAAGVDVQFFGVTARMPAGPAALTHDTGAVLLPVTLAYPNERDLGITIHPAVEVPATGTRAEKIASMTQRLADVFAGAIAAHPQDWHMLQRVWLDDLDPARVVAATGV
jgi:KDO2-lipid IV(A) lauroyltransferase